MNCKFACRTKNVTLKFLFLVEFQGQMTASKSLLSEAEELNLFALKLATNGFGESNVQTAKHYGNLGRLYQV